MSGHLKRLGIALMLLIVLLPVLTSAAGPGRGVLLQDLDRTSYSGYLQVPGTWKARTPYYAGRRSPLDRSMLPHIFDPLIAAQARTRQGSQPDTDLTPTATLSEEVAPRWAPDASLERIVFASNGVDVDGLPGIDPGVTTADGTYNLWVMRADGSQQQRLTMTDGANELDPAFDHGSRLVAFASNKTGTHEIYTIEPSTGTVTQITTSLVVAGNKRHPTWAADRTVIGFQLEVTPGNWDLYTIASSGIGQPQPLLANPGNDTDPAFHPSDANVIAYTSDRGGAKNIYVYNRVALTDDQVTNGGGDPTVNDKDPAWRWTGDMLAFASDRPQAPGDAITEYNIWTISGVGEVIGPAPTLKSNTNAADTEDDEDPAWSPLDINSSPPGGGTPQVQIAFQSRRPGGDPVDDADIWSVYEIDIVPPVLLGLDSGEAMAAEPRIGVPGDVVTLSVALNDIDSGVQGAVCEIKDPDGPLEDAAGVDHHEYLWISGPMGGYAGTAWVESDFETIATVALHNDGVAPDVDGTDKIWTGEFATPGLGSDFIVDVITVDEAGNSFEYDNIYGFTTQLFSPKGSTLFVDDHMSSQRFPVLPWSLHFDFVWPCGTYGLLNWGGLDPITGFPEAGGIWFHNFGTYIPGFPQNTYPERVDVWRIQCRGPVPRHVMDYYGPATDVQLLPGDYTQTRTVTVVDRAVWWSAPHSGDVYAVRGSVVDAATQAELMRFLDRGGRLFIGGEDLAWALTVDGQYGNTFLNQYLQANYVRDDLIGGNFRVNAASNGVGGDPFINGPFGHWGASPGPPAGLNTPHVDTTSPNFWDAYWFNVYRDVVTAGPTGTAAYNYASGGTPSILRHDSPLGFRSVYFPFGFEQICREYTGAPACLNYRGKLIHNMLCTIRTGTYTGRVLDKNGLKPILPPPVVEVLGGGGVVENAVRCNEDGSYVANGVRPGGHTLRVFAPGYIDHSESWTVHGGGESLPTLHDFVLSIAEPGSLSGTVTSAATGLPLANVLMTAFEPINSLTYPKAGDPPVYTGADGTYAIQGLPNADYEVTADGTAVAHNIQTKTATVLPAQNTPNVNFALTAADGTLEVEVTDSEVPANPIPNATVNVKNVTTGALVDTGVTDGNGDVSFSLQPSDYHVTAGAPGFQTSPDQTVTIIPLNTTAITIALVAVPPGSISGLISRQTDGALADGVLVEVFSAGIKIGEATSQATQIPGIPETANYHIDPVKAGTHTVIATKAGLTMIPVNRPATVTTGQRTGNVNFQVKPLHTFGAGLSMVSVPFDLSGTPATTLLGIPPGQLKLATYNPTASDYIYNPSPPADAFRLGMGYWLFLSNLRDLTTSGPVATDPYRIAMPAGWNIIGGPFSHQVDYSTVMVEDSTGALMSLQRAFQAGVLQSGLFTWMFGGYRTSITLAPFTGYWVLAFEQCTLVVAKPVGTLAASADAAAASRTTGGGDAEPFRAPRDGWSLRIEVAAGEATDIDNYLGVGVDATDAYDTHYDVQEPPPPLVSRGGVSGAFVAAGQPSLAADIRSPIGDSKAWDFVVRAEQQNAEVRLAWPDLAAVPREYDCALVDADGDRRVAMRTSRGYSFNAGAGGGERHFRVEVRRGAAGRLAVTDFVVVDSRGGAKTLAYSLTRDARVSVQVLNVAGRTVRGLAQAQQRSAGQNELVWDGRSDGGTPVPSGVYLVRLMAKTADGEAAGATRMMAVSR